MNRSRHHEAHEDHEETGESAFVSFVSFAVNPRQSMQGPFALHGARDGFMFGA